MEDPANKSSEPDMSDNQATGHEVSQNEENYGSEHRGLESSTEINEQHEEQKMDHTEAEKGSHVVSDEGQGHLEGGQGQIGDGGSGRDNKCETGNVEEREENKSKPVEYQLNTDEHGTNDTNTTDVPAEKMDVAVSEDKKTNPPSALLTKKEKSLLGNMSYEEETELRKTTSIGAILSGLSTGSYGNKAKENVVSIEAGVKRFRYESTYESNKRYRNDWGDNSWGGDSWGENSWNSWNEGAEEKTTDEIPPVWIVEENKLLEEEFGPGMVSLMVGENDIMVYICEICQSQMNGRKSLDVHLNGMKHLKKKNVWSKKRKLDLVIPASGSVEEEKDKNNEKTSKDTPVAAAAANPPAVTPQQSKSRLDAGYNSSTGYGQGNYSNQPYNQPPPYGAMMGMPPGPARGDTGLLGPSPHSHLGVVPPVPDLQKPLSTNIPKGHWGSYDATPPPPPISYPTVEAAKIKAAPVEEKPKVKTNLSGGATGTLLQKLAACAVKNFKDSDLATNVVIALVKTMKEYNHLKGDTKSIEILTEIDVKLRGLKAQMPLIDTEKKSETKTNVLSKNSAGVSDPSGRLDPNKGPKSSHNPTNQYYSSSGAQPENSTGTWYSQAKGNASGTPPSNQHSPGSKKGMPPVAGSVRSNATGYASHTNSGHYNPDYSSYDSSRNQMSGAKDAGGYSSKSTHSSTSADSYYSHGMTDKHSYSNYQGQGAPKAVMDIIQSSTAPPPPPPPPEGANTSGYGTQDYTGAGYQGAYPGYYNVGPGGSQYNQPY